MTAASFSATSETDERAQLARWLAEDFSDLAAEFAPLCLDPKAGRPLYLTHLPIAAAAMGAEFPPPVRDDLNAGYVYLTGSYYALDAVVDGHACGRSTKGAA